MHIDGEEIEMNGRARLKGLKRIEQHVAVFAAAHGHHDLVAFVDHAEIGNRLCCQTYDALFQFFLGNGFAVALIRRRFTGRGAVDGNGVGHGLC